AKQATRWMAPAAPVFAGAPAPTGMAQVSGSHRGPANYLCAVPWEVGSVQVSGSRCTCTGRCLHRISI
ncbi:hypothetical protein CX682_31610, partial [Pseudomonas sp. FFUP_PS_41]